MPYFQERPMRHIFLVEVSSWSENENSLKEKLTEKRHLAMLEIYGIVLPWIRWAQWKGLKQELQQILLHGIIRYMDWIWLNTKGRGVKPCEMYSRGMKQHTIRTVIFWRRWGWKRMACDIGYHQSQWSGIRGSVLCYTGNHHLQWNRHHRPVSSLEDFVPCARRLAKQLKEPTSGRCGVGTGPTFELVTS